MQVPEELQKLYDWAMSCEEFYVSQDGCTYATKDNEFSFVVQGHMACDDFVVDKVIKREADSWILEHQDEILEWYFEGTFYTNDDYYLENVDIDAVYEEFQDEINAYLEDVVKDI